MEMFDTKKKTAFEALKVKLGLENVMQAPRVQKVIVSVGTGSTNDKNKVKLIEDRITKITGQKPVVNKARKSIATFKLREGDAVGFQATLRGPRMSEFLDKLIHIALPRTKDFRGINNTIIDDMGNATIGIKENSIFPENGEEELRDIFGFAVTIVTTAKTKTEARKFFETIGIPFAKIVEGDKKKKKKK